jgi:hypothetical protein
VVVGTPSCAGKDLGGRVAHSTSLGAAEAVAEDNASSANLAASAAAAAVATVGGTAASGALDEAASAGGVACVRAPSDEGSSQAAACFVGLLQHEGVHDSLETEPVACFDEEKKPHFDSAEE